MVFQFVFAVPCFAFEDSKSQLDALYFYWRGANRRNVLAATSIASLQKKNPTLFIQFTGTPGSRVIFVVIFGEIHLSQSLQRFQSIKRNVSLHLMLTKPICYKGKKKCLGLAKKELP